MILYTIQNAELFNVLKKQKSITYQENQLDAFVSDNYIKYYDWMALKMDTNNITRPNGAKYPFWGWYKYSETTYRPDLRRSGHLEKNTKGVMLKLQLDDSRVLLSNFELWNYILNDKPIFDDENWGTLYIDYKQKSILEKNKIKEQTWNKIFTEFGDDPIQATFWELNYNDIIDVKFFTAR